jgi:hypothetical protein
MSTERGDVWFRAGDWILRDAEGNETVWSPEELDDEVDEEEPTDDELFGDDEEDDLDDDDEETDR